MICPHCSAETPDVSVFCPGCGRSVQETDADGFPELRADTTRDGIFGALAYVTLFPAILFLLLPSFKANRFVRFHSWQSVLLAITAVVLAACLRGVFAFFSLFPGIGFLLAVLACGLVFIALVFLWVVIVIKALQGEAYEVPWLGHFAVNLAK